MLEYPIEPSTSELNYYCFKIKGKTKNVRSCGTLDRYYLTELDFDIIRFFALNGPNPCFAITEGPMKEKRRGRHVIRRGKTKTKREQNQAIEYNYRTAKRHAEKLEEIDLLKRIKPKKKELFTITLEAVYVHMKDPTKKPENPFDIMKANQKCFPFFPFLNEILEITGKDHFRRCFEQTIKEKIYKDSINIQKLDLELKYYLPYAFPIFFENTLSENDRKLLRLISEVTYLKNSLIIFFANSDMGRIKERKKWPESKFELNALESEKALAYLEERDIDDDPLFVPGNRIKRILQDFNQRKFFFTGMLMHNLIKIMNNSGNNTF